MARAKRQPGVFSVEGARGVSWGIDYIHPKTQRRVRKILKGVNSEAEASKLRAIEIADAARDVINKAYDLKPKARAMTFNAVLDAYLNWSRENKKSWKADEYNAIALKAAFKGKLMSDINPFVVEKFKVERGRAVAKKTVNNELSVACRAIKKAVEWQKWTGPNPFNGIRFKIRKGKKPGCLSPEQVAAIIANIDHPAKKDMVAFAFYQGWRISEIRKLRWEDIDLENGRAWIVDPKNGFTVEVPLADEARVIVERQPRCGQYVFCKKNGDPWKSNSNAVIKTAAEKAGVSLPPRKKWHIFRRTWASMFLQAGGDVESLRVQGNWRDHSMPLWYADAADEDHRKGILNRMPKLDQQGAGKVENEDVHGRNLPEIRKVANINN